MGKCKTALYHPYDIYLLIRTHKHFLKYIASNLGPFFLYGFLLFFLPWDLHPPPPKCIFSCPPSLRGISTVKFKNSHHELSCHEINHPLDVLPSSLSVPEEIKECFINIVMYACSHQQMIPHPTHCWQVQRQAGDRQEHFVLSNAIPR